MFKTWYVYYFFVILQGSFQFLKLYGYPDVVSTLCNATVSLNIDILKKSGSDIGFNQQRLNKT